ncbi:tRNA glutamyl-Q(34) synthetase GluQRS [Sinisalibacter aestuarii]|uniref:tRNA glutamyl-Q synthetase n=1 Tax=Sinisalibacter aestuarii TaxID=2949426 RepID=A0ABQ5LRK2_9RHOB|nr:tRNA glutamyl-Q(34) synthetase GluQRS [Sinisalibacter aestuarii]GKY87629.1 tRNA glutamyl-Q synthetase [Sinisalibacter aestuarii]
MITRFAPSPTGLLHLGHAFSALTAWDMAQAASGQFLLRIEDIDRPRCKPDFEQAIYDDLHWLGLTWPMPVMRQSDRLPDYAAALDRLTAMGLTYPCSCSRADIRAALSAPQEGAQGPDGPLYPGTCRGRPMESRQPGDAIRLDMAKATALTGPITVTETGPGFHGIREHEPADMVDTIGDVVLARKDIGTSYHLAVVVDDAAQGITHVVRGEDLFAATPIHVLLQRLLALPTPTYHHHRLIRDEAGKRLAKRDDARAIRHYRAEGRSPAEIRALVGLQAFILP